MNWRALGACADLNLDDFDTPSLTLPRREAWPAVRAARRVLEACDACPVFDRCDADVRRRAGTPDRVRGVIQAGEAYDGDGLPARRCPWCRYPVVARGTVSVYCTDECQTAALSRLAVAA